MIPRETVILNKLRVLWNLWHRTAATVRLLSSSQLLLIALHWMDRKCWLLRQQESPGRLLMPSQESILVPPKDPDMRLSMFSPKRGTRLYLLCSLEALTLLSECFRHESLIPQTNHHRQSRFSKVAKGEQTLLISSIYSTQRDAR